MNDVVYTIGHSTHSTQKLIRLLSTHEITAVVDVRSQPYSRMNPQFNKENLKEVLNAAGIAYVFLGRQLGARTDDDSCYVDGKGVAGSFGLSREQVLERKTHQEPFDRLPSPPDGQLIASGSGSDDWYLPFPRVPHSETLREPSRFFVTCPNTKMAPTM